MRAHTILLGSLALFGCTDSMAPGGTWADPDPVELLEDGAGEWIPERAGLIDYGRARLTPTGAPLERTTPSPPSIHRDELTVEGGTVVVDDRDGLRVLWTDREVRMLLWVDKADFETVVYAPAWARSLPGPEDLEGPTVGARFPAGMMVDELDQDGEWTRIGWLGPQLEVEAWLPADHVRAYFRDVPDDEAPSPQGRRIQLEVGSDLLDLPYGEPFAFTVDATLRVFEVGPVEDGHQLVEAGAHGVLVRGWVAVDAIEPPPMNGFGFGSGFSVSCGGCWGDGGEVTLLRDALLAADADQQEIVGRTLRGLYRAPLRVDEATGAVAFGVSTPWGDAELWADAGDVTGAGWELVSEVP